MSIDNMNHEWLIEIMYLIKKCSPVKAYTYLMKEFRNNPESGLELIKRIDLNKYSFQLILGIGAAANCNLRNDYPDEVNVFKAKVLKFYESNNTIDRDCLKIFNIKKEIKQEEKED